MGHLAGALGVLVVLAVSGCDGGEPKTVAVTSPPPVTPTASPTVPTPTPTPTPRSEPTSVPTDVSCGLPKLDETATALGRSWALVTATRSTGDHEERLSSFAEAVDDLSHEMDSLPTQAAKAACGSRELAGLALQTTLLNYDVVDSGQALTVTYNSVADAANGWVEKVGLQDSVGPFTATNHE